jgi:DNA-binding SARP family transcriptional activator/Tfp pilus assembly protein PilF
MGTGSVMELRVLGPVEMWETGKNYNLGSLKARIALTVLVLNLGTIVSSEALIDRVWDSRPPHKARESLSVYVTRLRRVLRQVPGEPVRVISRAQGYRLEADPELVDLYQFRRLRRQAAALASEGEFSRAALLLSEADGLWRGPALAGLPGGSIGRLRQGLEEEYRGATLERAEIWLALGRYPDLVAELRRLSDRYPADEAFAAIHMKALYLSDRQSEALAVFRETRAKLATDFGIEPGASLSGLHEQMLRADPALAAKPVAHWPAPLRVPDTLPAVTGDFIGREEELRLLTQASEGLVVSVIEGMPAVGKSSLAAEAARAIKDRYPGGRLFLGFRGHDPRNPPLDPGGALHMLLRMLDVPADRIPRTLAERSAMWRAELARRRIVAVLDDVADADQILPLLPLSGESRILVTSRSRLPSLGNATHLTLDVLPDDDAAELFTRVAGTGDTDAGEVAAIVGLCGRLPLAIKLAARGLREGHPASLGELVDELTERSASAGERTGADPEVTAAFEVSYHRLDGDCRRFFRRLGLHPGTTITVHTAAALTGTNIGSAEALMADLLGRHLLEPAGNAVRFHDLTRQYAIGCAAREDTDQDRRRALDRLLGYYAHTVGSASELLYPHARRPGRPTAPAPEWPDALDTPHSATQWLEGEWRNVLSTARYAAQHERKQHCAYLIAALARFLESAGHWGEAADAHALALQACRAQHDLPGLARAALDLSLVACGTGKYPDALRYAETAAATCHSLADRRGEAEALNQVGSVHRELARFKEALAYHQEAGDLYRAAGDRRGMATTVNSRGIVCAHLGRYREAVDHFQAALQLFRQVSDRREEAKTLNNLGTLWLSQGHHQDALRAYQHVLEIFNEIGGEHNQAILYQNIGCIQHHKTQYKEALAAFRRALAIFRKMGARLSEVSTLNDMGATFIAMESYGAALEHCRQAEVMAWELGSSHERAVSLRGIAGAHLGQGHHREARDYYQRALRLAREIGHLHEEGKVLEGLAETVLQTQGEGAARIYWYQAYDLFRQLGVPEAETVRLRLGLPPPESATGTS